MSHIAFVTPYYPPEVGAPQTRISETAIRLVRRGHQVTVLTTLPNYPSGIVPEEYRHGRRQETIDGVNIIRVWSYVTTSKRFLHRVLNQLSFGLLAGILGRRAIGKPDILIVESPPLFDAFSGRYLAWRKRCPYIFTVADLWPEAAVQMGILNNKTAIRLAERLERSTYDKAAAIWTVTEGLRRILVGRGIPSEKVFMVPNGVDTVKFRPIPQAEARARLGWDNEHFTVMFAGTVGLVPGLMTLVDAAERLREYEDIRIMLVGDGAAKEELVREVARRGLTNFVFKDPQPHEMIPLVVCSADVCFSSMRALPLFKGTMPVKLYEAMGSGRAILLAAEDGLASQITVDEAHAAIQIEPQNVEALAAAILDLRNQPNLVRQLGENGRTYVEEYYDRDKLVDRLEEQVRRILDGKRYGGQRRNETQASPMATVAKRQ